MYHYDIFLIHMICFKIKKIKRGKLEKIYQLILWKWKTEIAFLRNQLHIWLLKQQNKKYQIDESKNNQKARNKRPNLHNLWGNNCQFSDNIFQWHFHLFRELEDGVVFPYKLNCSCVKKRLHVYILFFLNMYIYIYLMPIWWAYKPARFIIALYQWNKEYLFSMYHTLITQVYTFNTLCVGFFYIEHHKNCTAT